MTPTRAIRNPSGSSAAGHHFVDAPGPGVTIPVTDRTGTDAEAGATSGGPTVVDDVVGALPGIDAAGSVGPTGGRRRGSAEHSRWGGPGDGGRRRFRDGDGDGLARAARGCGWCSAARHAHAASSAARPGWRASGPSWARAVVDEPKRVVVVTPPSGALGGAVVDVVGAVTGVGGHRRSDAESTDTVGGPQRGDVAPTNSTGSTSVRSPSRTATDHRPAQGMKAETTYVVELFGCTAAIR